jgi:hypothetical protein
MVERNALKTPAKSPDEWIRRNARTMAELLRELQDAAGRCALISEQARRRAKKLPSLPREGIDMSTRLEVFQMATEMLERKARQAAKHGDAVTAAAAALKLGRVLATVAVIQAKLESALTENARRDAISAVQRLNARLPRKKRDATPEAIRAWISDWEARHPTAGGRGGRQAAAVHFCLDPSTITRRLNRA